MRPGDPQFEYFEGQLRPGHPALFARFAEANAAALASEDVARDLRYGPHPRQTLDLFRTPGAPRATIVYLHAGYWQSRDKSGFAFLAPPLLAGGCDVALLDYPLSPETRVSEIVAATVAAMPALFDLLRDAPVLLVGHSAGAQLAVEIGMKHAARIAGIVSISGVFDLTPLVGTTINDRLGLDAESAHAASPLFRVRPGAPPAFFAVGAEETAAFREQSRCMHDAWAAAGNRATSRIVHAADHFSILEGLGEIVRAVL